MMIDDIFNLIETEFLLFCHTISLFVQLRVCNGFLDLVYLSVTHLLFPSE